MPRPVAVPSCMVRRSAAGSQASRVACMPAWQRQCGMVLHPAPLGHASRPDQVRRVRVSY